MQKHYFKYASGYINIDAENLYLTNTGNWQETEAAKEKSPISKRENNRRIRNKNLVFLGVMAIVAVVNLTMVPGRLFLFKFLFAIPVIGYIFINLYLKRELGNRYKIPLSKIRSVEQHSDKEIKISFLNALGHPDFEAVLGLEPAGIAFLKNINYNGL